MMRVVHKPRPRTAISDTKLTLLRPLFRYSATRDAYVLRLIGNSRGPVLVVGRTRRRTFRAHAAGR